MEDATCVELLEHLEERFDPQAECLGLFTGLQDPGEPCGFNLHCVSGAECEIQPREQRCQSGVCSEVDERRLEVVNEGESCEFSSCATRLHCDEDTQRCARGVFGEEGEECDLNGPRFCYSGLVCRSDNPEMWNGSWFCLPPLSEGDPCILPYACSHGLTCQWFSGGEVGQCARPAELGETCGTWGTLECAYGLGCNDSGVCTDEPAQCTLPED